MRSIHASFRDGARAILPLVPALATLAVAFGIAARAAGFSTSATVVMSATFFAGSAQFVIVSLAASGTSLFACIGAAVLTISRYFVTGLALAPSLRGNALQRCLTVQLAVDETIAVAYDGEGVFDSRRLAGAGAVLYVVHVAATFVGALVGGALPDPSRFGIDALLPALLIALVWPKCTTMPQRLAAAFAAVIALPLVAHVPPGVPILAAAAAALIGLLW